MLNIIAIDGPSGVGKSTTAKRIAGSLGWDYLDTGGMYRAATLALSRAGASVEDWAAAKKVLDSLGYEQRGAEYFLKGENVSEAIRSPEITKAVSAVSADPRVREILVGIQRGLGKRGNWVIDGRDIGTVVFPDAACKIFLVASPESRAQRRMLELQIKGVEMSFDEVLADQARRDHIDSTREASPLCKATDAIEVDSSSMSLEEVVAEIIGIYRKVVAHEGKR